MQTLRHTPYNFNQIDDTDLDLLFFLKSLQNIYKNHGGLENIFSKFKNDEFVYQNINNFRNIFFQ